MAVLDDPGRTFASSDIVKLEVLPKAVYHRNTAEAEFYQEFFDNVVVWAIPDHRLMEAALQEASSFGINAADALHVAAAVATKAAELLTTEKVTMPIHRTTSVPVRTLHVAT